MVAIILFFPFILSPLLLLLVWKFSHRWVTFIAVPLSLVSATLGAFLLLGDGGTPARAVGLWGLLFSLATWRIIFKRLKAPKGS